MHYIERQDLIILNCDDGGNIKSNTSCIDYKTLSEYLLTLKTYTLMSGNKEYKD
jgi:hypothetical protein